MGPKGWGDIELEADPSERGSNARSGTARRSSLIVIGHGPPFGLPCTCSVFASKQPERRSLPLLPHIQVDEHMIC
jgi:hypothetical protein